MNIQCQKNISVKIITIQYKIVNALEINYQ